MDTVIAALRPSPSSVLIEEIKSNSKSLTHITAKFQKVLESFNVSIVNFYEGTVTEGLKGVVSRMRRLTIGYHYQTRASPY